MRRAALCRAKTPGCKSPASSRSGRTQPFKSGLNFCQVSMRQQARPISRVVRRSGRASSDRGFIVACWPASQTSTRGAAASTRGAAAKADRKPGRRACSASTAPPGWISSPELRTKPPGGKHRPVATRSGPAASARPGRSTTGRVHQAYGNIPQWTCLPHQKTHTDKRHVAIRRWQSRGPIVNMSWRISLGIGWTITLTTSRPERVLRNQRLDGSDCGIAVHPLVRRRVRRRRTIPAGRQN